MNKSIENKNTEKKEGMFNTDIEQAKDIHEAVKSMLKVREEYLNNKASEKKYAELKKTALGHGYETFFLKPGYFAVGSDFHGDYFSLYAFLVQNGYLIPNDNKFLVCLLVNDKDVVKAGETGFEYKILSKEELSKIKIKDREDIFSVMPGFDVNINFGGKIKLLGDYIDRGYESLMCLLLLDYLTKEQQKRLEESIQINKSLYVHYGNHESSYTGGLYGGNHDKNKNNSGLNLTKSLVKQMKSEKRMTLASLEMINKIPVCFSHTAMCQLHIYKIMGIIKTFYKIAEFEKVEVATDCFYRSSKNLVSVDDCETLKRVKERFLEIKETEEYKSLFESIEKGLKVKAISRCKSKSIKNSLKQYLSGRNKEDNIKNIDGNNRYNRQVCLDFLEKMAKKDNETQNEPGSVYKILKDDLFLLKDEDYFKLRSFIALVLTPNLYDELISNRVNAFFGEDDNNINEFYFIGLENGNNTAHYWPVEERFITPVKKNFKVWQFVGHDKISRYPHIRIKDKNNFDMGKDCLVVCVDTGRSSGYGQRSDAMTFIITPNLEFVIERFRVNRDKDLRVLPKDLKKEETCIAVVQNNGECKATQAIVKKHPSSEKKSSSLKKFSSFKRFISAFDFSVKNNNELKEVHDENKNNIKVNDMQSDKKSDSVKVKFDFSVKNNNELKEVHDQNKINIKADDMQSDKKSDCVKVKKESTNQKSDKELGESNIFFGDSDFSLINKIKPTNLDDLDIENQKDIMWESSPKNDFLLDKFGFWDPFGNNSLFFSDQPLPSPFKHNENDFNDMSTGSNKTEDILKSKFMNKKRERDKIGEKESTTKKTKPRIDTRYKKSKTWLRSKE